MTRHPAHLLKILDRGDRHRHRWLPTCHGAHCAWVGSPNRTRSGAARNYRGHVKAEARRDRPIRRARTITFPRPLTPHDQLPQELQ